ncbi:hypothetical protein [Sphingomonas sp.]|uniref:hypothetical protein n=1 Tax=Sphingomonas sp. TaxID=28214 RepID=UPI003F6F1613
MSIVPNSRPRMTEAELMAKLKPLGLTPADKLFVVGVRGYYLDTMGKPGVNDRGIYDDAIFIVAPGLHFSAYNGNTDPSGYRKGKGTGAGKGMANLKPGLWRAHQFGNHKGYPALIQIGGKVTVTRDGDPPYDDTGFFGINIHKGSFTKTSSEGCQTIHPDQWAAFMANMNDLAKRLGLRGGVIPYALIVA